MVRKYRHLSHDPVTRRLVPMYVLWNHILARCRKQHTHYRHYGGRGIAICQQWHDFDRFVDDIEASIGAYPGKGWSLDRINNDGNYEPGNIRWATSATQIQNRSVTKLTTALVAQIRAKYATGKYYQYELADIYGVNQPQISRVVNKKEWK